MTTIQMILKRFAVRHAARAAAMLAVLTLVSCKTPEPAPDGGDTTTPGTEEKTGVLPIWSSGSGYRILYSAAEDDNLGQTCAQALAKAIKEATGVNLSVYADSDPNVRTADREICVGRVARTPVQNYLSIQHDTFDYTIAASGSRLLLAGAGGWSTKAAVDRFITEYVRPKKDVPDDLAVTGNCRGQFLFPKAEGTNLRLLDNNIWSYNEEVIPEAWAALGGDPRNSFRSRQYTAMVNALLPDVFAWQEYAQAMQDIVEPMLADRYVQAQPAQAPTTRSRTPLFYNKETVEPVEVRYFLFPGAYNNSDSKSYTAAVFRHIATGAYFIAVGTHLWYKSESDAPGSNAARVEQATYIAEEVESLLTAYDCPVFVMGDMNSKLGSDAMNVFTDRGYLDCGISATGYKDSFAGHHTCSAEKGFSWSPQQNNNCATAIDHIFEYNCSGKASVKEHRIITAAFTISLTDHCPRYIDVNLESGSVTPGPPPEDPDPTPVEGAVTLADAPTRILFIGNSFTKDAVEHLPGIVAAAGIKNITMAHLYYGGRTIPVYNDWSKADYTLYKAEKGAASWTSHGDLVSIAQVATGGRWDIITIQEHTGNYCAWSWTDAEKTATVELLAKLRKTQKTAPQFYYILSQAYYNMNKIASGSKPYITWTDQAGMWAVIAEQARKVVAETDVKDVISTGVSLQNLRTSGLDTPLNLTRDGYHMDYGTARYAAACTVYDKLIEPVFGLSLDNNSYRYLKSDFSEGSYSSPVDDRTAPICRKAARYAIESPYDVTDMHGEGAQSGTGGDAYAFQGSGTAADPYLVATAEDMKGIASVLVNGSIRYFKMTADVDMASVTDWTPCVTEDKPFGIQFDGNSHTISHFSCTDKPFASLFGLVYGGVSNLRLKDCTVTHSDQCALLAVWGGNGTGSCSAAISGVHAENCTVSCTATAATVVGGLVANACDVTITDCSFQGSVNSAATSGNLYVGGLVGKIARTGVRISRCSADVRLKCTAGNRSGGLVGSCYTNCAVTITDCYTKGAITGKSSYMGGIVGELVSNSTVERCYSTMDLTGGYNHGGIVGRASNLANPNSSGTFDSLLNITVRDCIAWNGAIRTSGSGEKPASHYSSGAVVGFTVYKNYLSNCKRRPDMTFQVYANADYNILTDTEDTSPTAPLVKPSTETYHCPYNGKAVAAGATVSSVAQTLGWSTSTWDFSEDYPKLK